MESPAKNSSANLVIETLEGHIVVVLISTLPTEYCQSFDQSVKTNDGSR